MLAYWWRQSHCMQTSHCRAAEIHDEFNLKHVAKRYSMAQDERTNRLSIFAGRRKGDTHTGGAEDTQTDQTVEKLDQGDRSHVGRKRIWLRYWDTSCEKQHGCWEGSTGMAEVAGHFQDADEFIRLREYVLYFICFEVPSEEVRQLTLPDAFRCLILRDLYITLQ